MPNPDLMAKNQAAATLITNIKWIWKLIKFVRASGINSYGALT